MNSPNRLVVAAPYLLMAVVVMAFNASSVRLDVLVLDDLNAYKEVVEGEFLTARFYRSLVNPFVNHVFVTVMAQSPFWAKMMILVLVMVPLSGLFYHLSTEYLLIPKNVALFAATVSLILPGQKYIPAFVVGSYNTWGLLFYFGATILCLRYLARPSLTALIAATLSYFAAIEVTINIFLAAPLVLLLVTFRRRRKDLYALFTMILAVSTLKVAVILLNPWATTTPTAHSLGTLLRRFANAIGWALPSPVEGWLPMAVVACVLIIVGFGLAWHTPVKGSAPNEERELRFGSSDRARWVWHGLYGLLLFSTSLLPSLASKYFSARYVYVTGFALSLMIGLAIHSILHRGRLKKIYASSIALLLLTGLVGIQRIESINKLFDPVVKVHSRLRTALSAVRFPRDSQLVVLGGKAHRLHTGGYWKWSSGYLMYATSRDDVMGLVGLEGEFYDPFNPTERNYSHKMRGLDLAKPLFLFRLGRKTFVQLEFSLQWSGSVEDGEWALYRSDPQTGETGLVRKGRGRQAYDATLLELRIPARAVCWGGAAPA